MEKVRAEAFTHRHLGKDRKEELSQLDDIIGSMGRNDEVYIHNAGRLWAAWDHYPIFVRIEEEPYTSMSFREGIKSGRAGSRQQKSNYYFSTGKS